MKQPDQPPRAAADPSPPGPAAEPPGASSRLTRRPVAKRLYDLVFASAGLVVLSPLFFLLALGIKFGDGGPVFFRQVRVGQFGRPFRMFKFRSMVVDAEKKGLSLTQAGDARVTRAGRWLRKWKLDELPQLLNVVLGQMSLVGPRPEVPRYVELYTAAQRRVLELKPGITDLASLLFREEEALLQTADHPERFYVEFCLPKKIELNLTHARRAGLWADTRIILQTLVRVGVPRGTEPTLGTGPLGDRRGSAL